MEEKLFDPMIDIFYEDLIYGKRQIKIILADATIKDDFIDKHVKVDINQFNEYLNRSLYSFSSYEKYAKEKNLSNNYYVNVVYNKNHFFIPIGESLNENLDEKEKNEIREKIKEFENTVCDSLLYICRECAIGLGDIEIEIGNSIYELKGGTKFSFKQFFDKYKFYIDSPDQEKIIKENILKKMPRLIKVIDAENDEYEKVDLSIDFNFKFDID